MRRSPLIWLLGAMPNKEVEVRVGDLLFNLVEVTYDDVRGVIIADVAGGDFYESSNASRDAPRLFDPR